MRFDGWVSCLSTTGTITLQTGNPATSRTSLSHRFSHHIGRSNLLQGQICSKKQYPVTTIQLAGRFEILCTTGTCLASRGSPSSQVNKNTIHPPPDLLITGNRTTGVSLLVQQSIQQSYRLSCPSAHANPVHHRQVCTQTKWYDLYITDCMIPAIKVWPGRSFPAACGYHNFAISCSPDKWNVPATPDEVQHPSRVYQ